MGNATHDDVLHLFLGVQDDDEGLIETMQQKGGRLNLLLGILRQSDIQPRDEFER